MEFAKKPTILKIATLTGEIVALEKNLAPKYAQIANVFTIFTNKIKTGFVSEISVSLEMGFAIGIFTTNRVILMEEIVNFC